MTANNVDAPYDTYCTCLSIGGNRGMVHVVAEGRGSIILNYYSTPQVTKSTKSPPPPQNIEIVDRSLTICTTHLLVPSAILPSP